MSGYTEAGNTLKKFGTINIFLHTKGNLEKGNHQRRSKSDT